MITLSDGVTTLTLNHILWPNRGLGAGAAGSERVTLGNRLVVQRLTGSAGREIILEARLDGSHLKGWWLWSQVGQLELWRDLGTTLTLNYDGEIRRGVVPLDGIDIAPVFSRSTTPVPGDLCAGVLKIHEV